ncbi:MBL fold metallo-hydrolase [bacterium]|nr:MBL fold metallo-hydrolase [bacterium]
MKYTCWGAARQVTGSMHLLEFENGYKILMDCGLDYEKNDDPDLNLNFPFEPNEIDVVILSHAHIDHSGNIPNLVKQGFEGHIFCTEPTAYLLDKLWADSVNIQNLDRKKRNGMPKLYGFAEIKKAQDRIITLPFYKKFELSPEISVELYEAGHIIGAASIVLEIKDKKTTRIGFTGDLGNYGSKLIVDPKPMENLDYLICEATYGNRSHKVQISPLEELKSQVIQACVNKAGRLIIPAFSVGRTQAILFTLKQLFESGEVPSIRVFADSPLALASTNIHNKFRSYLNEEAKMSAAETGELFDFKELHLVQDESDAQDMELYHDSCIIVSSAGMLEGGRIQQHLQDHVSNPLCTVLIAGFCTPGTLGAKLLDGINPIRIKNQDRYVYAKVLQTDVFSAHPDKDGLLRYIESCKSDSNFKLFIVHGEESGMEAFSELVKDKLNIPVEVPRKGQTFSL